MEPLQVGQRNLTKRVGPIKIAVPYSQWPLSLPFPCLWVTAYVHICTSINKRTS